MPAVTSLGFNIFSTYNGSGMRAARRDIRQLDNAIIRVSNVASAASKAGIGVFAATAVAAVPTMGTLASAVGKVSASFVAMAVSSGTAGGIFGVAVAGAVKRTFELVEAEKKLNSAQKDLVKSVGTMGKSWNRLMDNMAPELLGPVTTTVKGLTNTIRQLPPVLRAVSPVAQEVADSFKEWTERDDGLKRFLGVIKAEGVPSLQALTNAGRDALAVLGIAFRTLAPEGTKMAEAIERGAASLRTWAEGGGFQRWLDRVAANGPMVRDLMDALGRALARVREAVSGLAPEMFMGLTLLFTAIANMPIGMIQAMIVGFIAAKVAIAAFTISALAARVALGALSIALGIVRAAVGAYAVAQILLTGSTRVMLASTVAMRIGLAAMAIHMAIVRGATLAWAAAQWILNAAFVASPIGLIVIGIAALVAAIIWVATQTTFFQTIWAAVWPVISSVVQTAWTIIQNVIQVAWTIIQGVWAGIQIGIKIISVAFQVFAVIAQAAWLAIRVAIGIAAAIIGGIIAALVVVVQNVLAPAFVFLWQNVIVPVWNGITTAINIAWSIIQPIWNAIVSFIQGVLVNAWNILRTVAEAVWNAIQTVISVAWGVIQVIWNAIVAYIQGPFMAVWNFLRTTVETVWNAIQTVIQIVWTFIRDNIWQPIVDFIRGPLRAGWEFALEAAEKAWNSIQDVLEKVWNFVRDEIFEPLRTFVTETIPDAFDTAVDAIGKAWDKIKDKVAAPIKFVIDTIWNGGVVGGWNKIAGLLGLGKMEKWTFSGFAEGGSVNGPGGKKQDKVPAMLSRGEFVMQAKAVQKFGPEFMRSINQGQINGFQALAKGGFAVPGFAHGGSHDDDDRSFRERMEDRMRLGGDSDGRRSDLGTGGFTSGDVPDATLADLGLGFIKKALGAIGGLVSKFPGVRLGTETMVALVKKALAAAKDKIMDAFMSFMPGGGGGGSAAFGSGAVGNLSGLVLRALGMAGESPANLGNVLRAIAKESGGNPRAINLWDSNARAGIPSMGLLQTIGPTFNRYAGSLRGLGAFNPLANVYAAVRYARARYGSGWSARMARPGGYASGGMVGFKSFDEGGELEPGLTLAHNGTGAPETVLPNDGSLPGGLGLAGGMSGGMGMGMPASLGGGSFGGSSSGGGAGGAFGDGNTFVEILEAWETIRDKVMPEVQDHAENKVPGWFDQMGNLSGQAWMGMGQGVAANWELMKTGTFADMMLHLKTNVPQWSEGMRAAMALSWLTMATETDTAWAGMRDTTFADANNHMATLMPQWGDEMSAAVTAAWLAMGEATAAAWLGMQEATRGPTNWIIANSYNNGIARLWNQVAEVIFDGGGRSLPNVATLAAGGPVHGAGGPTADRVPAMLSAGEHVLTAREVASAGGHAAVQRMRAMLGGGQGAVGGGHLFDGEHPLGLAVGGWLANAGDVPGSSPAIGTYPDLLRGWLMHDVEDDLEAISGAARSSLGGSDFRKMAGLGDVLRPVDWITQYLEKDDELNKVFAGMGPPWIPGVSDARTSWGGVAVNQRTAQMLDMAMALGGSFSATQGSWSTSVAASAGTHAGGGVVDLVPASNANVAALRAVGFAAWNRGPPAFSPHIHAVAIGDPTASGPAQAQVASFFAGGNGLAGGGPDNFGGGMSFALGEGEKPTGALADMIRQMRGPGQEVDPADIDQFRPISFDSGGILPRGYSMVHNGTGRPEPLANVDTSDFGGVGEVNVTIPINVQGNLDSQAVDRIENELVPKLRVMLQQGIGKRY